MWLCFVVIVVLCWLDYSLFTEGKEAFLISDSRRKLAHTGMLALIIATGYVGWLFHPAKWLKTVWLYANIIPIVLILLTGMICYQVGYADKQFLKTLGDLRLFFCSPVLYFMFYILSVISGRVNDAARN
jgi:hypothetical protein